MYVSHSIVWVYIKGYALNFSALKATIIEYGRENEKFAEAPTPPIHSSYLKLIIVRDIEQWGHIIIKRKKRVIWLNPFSLYLKLCLTRNSLLNINHKVY